jgi:hypothetical protein
MADHVIHHTDDSGTSSMAVVLIALLVIVALAVFALRAFPLQGNSTAGDTTDINVDVPAITTPVDSPTGTPQ